MMKISKSRMRGLVKAWEGHVLNSTDIETCTVKSNKCPINIFFMEMKSQLE